MQDFYIHFRPIFDLELNSFFNFMNNHISAGNYVKKYGNFENIAEYFKSNNREFSRKKPQTNESRYSIPDMDFTNIFEWNSDSIINDLKGVLIDLQKAKIDSVHLSKFILFLNEDLNNEHKIFNNDNFDLMKVKKDFGIENNESKNFLENSLLTLKVNKETLEKLQVEFLETNKPNFPKSVGRKKTKMNSSKKQITEKVTTIKGIVKVQWKGYDSDLFYLLNELELNGFLTDIDKNNFIKLIENFFIDKSGKSFKGKRITQGMNNLFVNKNNKSRNSFKIDDILSDVKSLPKKNIP